jgi:Coenzyme PQQ synthesis protein D (PqqD)
MNESIQQESIQRTGDTPVAYLQETLLMMSVERGQYFSLNRLGTRIWELLENPTTEDTLVEQLTAEYDVTPEVCAAEVAAFLAALRHRELLADVDSGRDPARA